MSRSESTNSPAEEWAGGAMMGLICVIALAQVGARYVFGQSLGWSEELVRYLFVAMTFLAFSGNVARREHLSVHLLPDSVPRRPLAIIQAVAVALFTAAGVSGVPVRTIARRVWPLFFAEVVALAAITYIPGLSLWLPSLMN